MPAATETTLMLSETWFTTHASSRVRGLTDTGSMPTGTSRNNVRSPDVDTSKTDNRASGVFMAKRRVPSGDSRIGFVCAASKLTKLARVTPVWVRVLADMTSRAAAGGTDHA